MDEEMQRALDQMTAHAKIGVLAERMAQMLVRVLLQADMLSPDRREVLAQLLHLSAEQWETLGDTRLATETRQLLALVEPAPEPPTRDLPE